MNAKTQAQEMTEYVEQLQELLNQSALIKQEINRHMTFSKLHNRIGAIHQQLQFIRSYIRPKTTKEKIKYFKHNKLALKLINHHLDEIEHESGSTRLRNLEDDAAQWRVIEALREETLHNIDVIEAALKDAELVSKQGAILEETKDIMLFEGEVAELANKTELLLHEIKTHGHRHESVFEQIHHLHHDLQFIKLHAYARNHAHEAPLQQETPASLQAHHSDFLNHHYDSLNKINGHLFHLQDHWGHLLHKLHGEHHDASQLKALHEEIKHTIEQFEEKINEIEANNIHYMQHPGIRIVPIKFNKK